MGREQRKLAAIVATDVVGYSRLMGLTEGGTLAALKAVRHDLFDPTIAAHGGRVVKTTGDGMLLEFPSVVEAVRSSIEIQTAMSAAAVEVVGAGKLQFRMGVHQGDVVVVDDDVFGDDVNVAARLQEIAEPGGLCLSDRVREDLVGKFDIGLQDLGARSLKNIARPVHAWGWTNKPSSGASSVPASNERWRFDKSDQRIGFCRTHDAVRLAYASVGDGPPLVKAGQFFGHLEHDWDIFGDILGTLANAFTVVRYDTRGTGMSDWDADISFEAWIEDLKAVVDTVGVKRFPLIGFSQGCALSVAFAARYPERVSHLILYGGFAVGQNHWSDAKRQEALAVETLYRLRWHDRDPSFRRMITSRFMPDATKAQADAFDALMLRVSPPDCAAKHMATVAAIDVRELLPKVQAPTLVLHGRDDRVVPVELGRQLATAIPGARFVSFASQSHIVMTSDSASERFFDEIRLFLGS